MRSASSQNSSLSSASFSGCSLGQVVRLREVVGQVVQLPHVVLVGVVDAGGEPLDRLRREVPRDPVEPGAGPPAVLVDRPAAERLEVLHRVPLLGGRRRRTCRGSSCRPSAPARCRRRLVGSGMPTASRTVGAMSMQCVNCDRTSPPPSIRCGHATTIGSRVPPRWLPVCLPHWNGVLLACAHAAAKCGAVWSPPSASMPPYSLDQLELLLGVEDDAVEERHLVERAGGRALHAGAVVAPDVEDQGVVEVAHLLDRRRAAGRRSSRRSRSSRRRPPSGARRASSAASVRESQAGNRSGRSVSSASCGTMPELLLARERLLAVGVPALVELALVPVGPLLRDVVRGVAAAGRVVHEPRLLRVLGADRVQPLDGLVGEVVGEVVLLAVLALRYAEHRVVLGDDRVVLAGGAAQEAPEVVEAPGQRPPVERPGGALDVVRRQVPLAEAAGDVAVLAQDPRQRCARCGAPRRCSRGTARGTPRSSRSRPGGCCARSAAPRASASRPP